MQKNTRNIFIMSLLLGFIVSGSSSAAHGEELVSGLTHNAYQNKDRNQDAYLASNHVEPFAGAGSQWGNGADARYDKSHAGNN